jgi:TrmH family RNA methyltransferase
MPVVEASTEEILQWLSKQGIQSLAALPDAEQEYTDADMRNGIAIVVGSEDEGLTQTWIDHSNLHVRIPMLGKNDSLNVSSASAVLLYEAARQRKRRK